MSFGLKSIGLALEARARSRETHESTREGHPGGRGPERPPPTPVRLIPFAMAKSWDGIPLRPEWHPHPGHPPRRGAVVLSLRVGLSLPIAQSLPRFWWTGGLVQHRCHRCCLRLRCHLCSHAFSPACCLEGVTAQLDGQSSWQRPPATTTRPASTASKLAQVG
jgi:hypothetical protein